MPTPCSKWFLTINNPYVDKDILQSYVSLDYPELVRISNHPLVQEIHGQYESGDSGTLHIQACVSFIYAVDFDLIHELAPRAHIQKCRSWKYSVAYCTKTETRAYSETYSYINHKRLRQIRLSDVMCSLYSYGNPYNGETSVLLTPKQRDDLSLDDINILQCTRMPFAVKVTDNNGYEYEHSFFKYFLYI